ncbi:MAG: hypothetical protein K0Q46_947 [Rhodococcus erythropolis]|nr:hypothetical protein [Rhodococcus erythropolis]
MTNAAKKLQEAIPGDGHNTSGVLQDSVQRLLGAAAERAMSSVADRVSNTSDRLNDYAEGGGGGLLAAVTGSKKSDDEGSSLKSAVSDGWEGAKDVIKGKVTDVKDAVTGGGDSGGKSGGKGKKLKLTNIVESIDVGAPVQLVYDQWTQFTDFPSFMKKVERVEQESDEKLEWKAQVFLSHRTWEATIIEQVPDERIVWRSKGAKGYVDGAVTFHEVTPDLTRILVILEYQPKGFFEKTGNLWRAPGRRVRLELKHFQRHAMTQSILHPDEVEGWRGEIRDGEVVEPEEDETQLDQGEELDDGGEGEEPEYEEPEEESAEAEEPEEEPEEEPAPASARRGRPRKTAPASEKAPVRRGRPRKTSTESAGSNSRQGARR